MALAAVSARDASTARTAVRFAATRTRALVSSLGGVLSPMLPFQCASAMIELSEAFAVLEEDGASALAARDAEHIARMHGFHHLLHRLEHPKQRAAQVPATPLRRSIVESVEALEGAELVGAAN